MAKHPDIEATEVKQPSLRKLQFRDICGLRDQAVIEQDVVDIGGYVAAQKTGAMPNFRATICNKSIFFIFPCDLVAIWSYSHCTIYCNAARKPGS